VRISEPSERSGNKKTKGIIKRGFLIIQESINKGHAKKTWLSGKKNGVSLLWEI